MLSRRFSGRIDLARWLFLALLAGGAASPSPLAARELVTIEGRAFDRRLVLQAVVDDRAAGREALAAARAEVAAVEMLLDPVAGVVQRLADGAGTGPQPAPAELVRFLERTLAFCRWSENVHGPLGGWLYTVWGGRHPAAALPGAEAIARASELASCRLLEVDADAGTVSLAPQVRIDPWGFAEGFAVDRAIDVLAAAGVDDATVLVGSVQRGVGRGPDGHGWPLLLPALPERLAAMLDGLRLAGRSVALAGATLDGELRIGGQVYPPYLDQRRGRPPVGTLAVAAATELALDAQGVAVTCFLTGSRQGTWLVGQLRPAPAVVWLVGGAAGSGIVTDYRWSTAAGEPP